MRTRFYLIRHARATHLDQDWSRKLNGRDFVQLMKEWESAELTKEGEAHCRNWEGNIPAEMIYHSPMPRARQTAALINHTNLPMQEEPDLSEIFYPPLPIFYKMVLSIERWIDFCVYQTLFTLSCYSQIKESGALMNRLQKLHKNAIFVSHEARIVSMLIYAFLSPRWHIVSRNVKPLGVSVLEYRGRK